MEIIITGTSGFVGKNLLVFLQQKGYVTNSLSLRNQNWKNNFNKDADAIIHLAGKTQDTLNVVNPDEYYKINRDLTIDLFNEFINSDIKIFFYFSSVKAVANSIDGILTEDEETNPITHYGKSKIEAEKYILNQELPKGKKIYIIRPCMIHGPGSNSNLTLLYRIVEKGLPWPLTLFHNQRSFLGIDNLNFLIYQMIIKDDLISGIYNFADDEALSTNELIEIINKTLDKKTKFWEISKDLIEKITCLGDKLKLPLNSERLKKLTESYIVSNNKIKSALGIEKLPLSTAEGLIKTIKSFKEKK